jgi:cytoskeleton protein RodZ
MLRRARQSQGLHIAVLAASIKVSTRKLELLESDQLDKLLDPTFIRALAQSVCRSLKIDAAPVLAQLPQPSGRHLDQVNDGLNAPFRDRPGRFVPQHWASPLSATWIWAAAVLAAAAAVYYLPSHWLPFLKPAVTRTSGTQLGEPVAPKPAPATEPSSVPKTPVTVALAPSTKADTDVAATEPVGGLLQLRVSAQSWVEVSDGDGKPLLARLLQPGESVGLDGAPPLKLRIGNASGTQVVFRGQVLDLAAFTRENVARLELK